MSLILRKSLASNASQKRIIEGQYKEVTELRNASLGDMKQMLAITNAGQTPAEAYREFDSTTKIDMVPAGEYATLTRLMMKARSINIGREVFEYRAASRASDSHGKSSMSGQIGINMDHVDYKYPGTVVPVHDLGFGRRWRELEAMRADGFDALVDDSREAERSLMGVIDNYLWDGDSSLSMKGSQWLGIKNDPTVANATIGVDLDAAASSAVDIRNEVSRIRDILRITNNCTQDIRLGVSREILSNWERPFSVTDSLFGTVLEYVMKLRGISEIYEDSRLTGNQIVMFWDDQQGFHPVVGMGLSSYAVPRLTHNADFNFIKWCAVGFIVKTDFEGRTCALYGA